MNHTYVLIHFWPTVGGYHKRIEMLLDTLRTRAVVERVATLSAFGRLLLCREPISVLICISLTAPFALLLRLFKRNVRIYYMVRGDEITYVKHDGRYFRAFVALLLQAMLRVSGCHFVFVSEDLRVIFERRLGRISRAAVLPNTIGKPLPKSRRFDGRIGLIGNFASVKNIEWPLQCLSAGRYDVHLFGNRDMPAKWRKSWLHSHGVVANLKECLQTYCSLVILADTSAGFPNVLVDALEAGCAVLVHREFPFSHLPIGARWRFDLRRGDDQHRAGERGLEEVLSRILQEQPDFAADNRALMKLVESDWEERVWDTLG